VLSVMPTLFVVADLLQSMAHFFQSSFKAADNDVIYANKKIEKSEGCLKIPMNHHIDSLFFVSSV